MPTARRNISRRNVLRLGAGAAMAASAPVTLAASRPNSQQSTAKPRNVIFMVADGMSPGVPALAEAFSHIVRAKGTNWRDLAQREDVTRGYFDMASLDSLVTDSAAASSSWGSGSRIFNWALNMLPDGRELKAIGPLSRERGKRVGLVTTTRVSHATPAGFAAAAPNRDLEDDIAPQYIDRVDLLLGGGRQHFDPAIRKDQRDLLAEYRSAKWSIVENRDDLLKQPPATDLLLGLFSNDHVPYTIDRRREQSLQQQVPTLAEMTHAALANLSRNEAGFLLQVEGGRVDHAAHDNDAASMLHDQLAFDDAIGVALEFARERNDTLIVITTDHGTGNPGLCGMGSKYQRSNAGLEQLAKSTASFDALNARVEAIKESTGASLDAAALAQLVLGGTGIEVSKDDAATLAAVVANGQAAGRAEVCAFQSTLAGLLGQALANRSGVTFTGIVHTSDWALSLAVGPGRERFSGLRANTDAFEIIAECFGIEHRNPRMTPDEAKPFALRTLEIATNHRFCI